MGLWKHCSLLLFFITSASCCGMEMNHGNITLDQEIEVNDSLRIECSLFNSSIIVNNSTYRVSSKNLILKFEGKSLYNINIVNDLSIEYVVENADVDDSGAYSCYVNIPELKTKVLVCATYAAVGYKPLPVENFSCISYEYTNLTCSWVKPYNPVRTSYLLWDYQITEILKRPCPDVLNDTSCRWTLDTKPPYRLQSKKLYFIITGKNSLGESKHFVDVDHFKIVLPGIPRNVMIMNVTETSLKFHWLPPKYMGYQFIPGLEYSIRYQPFQPYSSIPKEI